MGAVGTCIGLGGGVVIGFTHTGNAVMAVGTGGIGLVQTGGRVRFFSEVGSSVGAVVGAGDGRTIG